MAANVPTSPIGVALWNDAQARAKVLSDVTTTQYNAYIASKSVSGQLKFAPGEGSNVPGSFVTNGKQPNTGNS